MKNLDKIKKIICTIFLISINYGCSQTIEPGQMKWISKYDFLDLYKKNVSNGNFGPETGLKLTIFKFLDDKTIFLAGSKDLHAFYNKPGYSAVLFISNDMGKNYKEVIFPGEAIKFIAPSEKYTLVETNTGGNSTLGKNDIYLLDNSTLQYKRIDEYSSKSKIMYSQFNGESVIYSNNGEKKILNVFTKEENKLPLNLREINCTLKKNNTLVYLLENEIHEYDIKTSHQKSIKKLKNNYDFLHLEDGEYLLGKSNSFKTKVTVYDQNENELYVEDEKTIEYYRYKNFACYFKETRPYTTLYFSYDYGKTWKEYHTKEFFTTVTSKGFYKDKYILIDVGFYDKNDNSHILVGEFQK